MSKGGLEISEVGLKLSQPNISPNVKHNSHCRLRYLKQTCLDLCAYTNLDFAGSKSNRKTQVVFAFMAMHKAN